MRISALSAAAGLIAGAFAVHAGEATERVHESAEVLGQIMSAKDHAIPRDLLGRAHCVGIVPSVKRVGFIVGAKYGKGIVICRTENSIGWSAPSTIRVEGGNIGLQIGIGETDLIFVVMNKKGEDHLLRDKFTIGADASCMAGPIGRETTAETDAMLRAEILAYSRARAVFAGVTLNGATLRPEDLDNARLYGSAQKQSDIVHGKVPPPASADELYAELKKWAPVRK